MSSGGGQRIQRIGAVEAYARSLSLRVQQSPLFQSADVFNVVRQLYIALRHLRVEVADPDSLINGESDASTFARQLQPLVEDCEFALKQLEAVLEKYGDGGRDVSGLADRLTAVRSRLVAETTNVDVFLDTVQLYGPASNSPDLPPWDGNEKIDDIKDTVDNIASGLLRSRHHDDADDEEDRLWVDFKTELEKEGFSPQVLHRHKEVLRAYMRELESVSALSSAEAPPTVRGLLEKEARAGVSPPVPQKSSSRTPYPPSDDESSLVLPTVRVDGRGQTPSSPCNEAVSPYFDNGSIAKNESVALIYTKDLLNLECPVPHPPGTGLRSSAAGDEPFPVSALQRTGASSSRPRIPASGDVTRQPNLRSLPVTTTFRLAPDSRGREIPLDACWTKMRRTIVSPEVLDRAGERYEARPEYVAVLGRLSREQIIEYARQSAQCRAARSEKYVSRNERNESHQSRHILRSKPEYGADGKTVSSDTEVPNDREALEADARDGLKNLYIVNPPGQDRRATAKPATPKSILKNRNENRVRFDPEPHELAPEAPSRTNHEEERSRRSHRGNYGNDVPDRDRAHRRDTERQTSDRSRAYGTSQRHDRNSERHRRNDRREQRSVRKKAWGETLGIVGIGGAAASLIGVLTEAAVSM